MSSAPDFESEIRERLGATVPDHLRERVTVEEVKGLVREHLEARDEELARFPDDSHLPWTDMIAYDNWELPTLFVYLILNEAGLELFFGTGHWPEVRQFAEHDSDDIPAADLHRECAARFTVPRPPLVLDRAAVREWLGRAW
jgi:hypothetical protein